MHLTRIACSPLGCGHKDGRANRVPGPGGDGRSCTSELRQGGGRVVGVTTWVLVAIEGGTLVFSQWDPVLDAQWQVRLQFNESKHSISYASSEETKLTLAM